MPTSVDNSDYASEYYAVMSEWNVISLVLHWMEIYKFFKHFTIICYAMYKYTHLLTNKQSDIKHTGWISLTVDFQHLLKYQLPTFLLSFSSNWQLQNFCAFWATKLLWCKKLTVLYKITFGGLDDLIVEWDTSKLTSVLVLKNLNTF